MKIIVLLLFVGGLLCDCAYTSVIKIDKLKDPITLVATTNYLPTSVAGIKRPEYTIYEESKWDCNYLTSEGDYVCCSREPFSSMSPWKYCLLVDTTYSGIGFFELGTGEYHQWPEFKQQLFRKVSAD